MKGETLAERLVRLRKATGKTQDDIAAFLNVKRQTYSAYERGVSDPDILTIEKFSNLYNVSTDYILGLTSNPQPDIELDEIQFALFGEVKELTEDQKQDILDYARYIKQKRASKDDTTKSL